MLTMNSPLPPKLASSDTIEAMHALLTVIGNPELAKANLDAILAAKAALDEATAANTAAAKEAQDAGAAPHPPTPPKRPVSLAVVCQKADAGLSLCLVAQ